MADTSGLMKTRGEWQEAVSTGDTSLTHKDWYEQKYGPAKTNVQSEEEAKKSVKAGYDKVAAKRNPEKATVA